MNIKELAVIARVLLKAEQDNEFYDGRWWRTLRKAVKESDANNPYKRVPDRYRDLNGIKKMRKGFHDLVDATFSVDLTDNNFFRVDMDGCKYTRVFGVFENGKVVDACGWEVDAIKRLTC